MSFSRAGRLTVALVLATPAVAQKPPAVSPPLLMATAAGEPVYAPAPDWTIERAIVASETPAGVAIQPILFDSQTRLGMPVRDMFFRSAMRIVTNQALAAAAISLPWQPDRSTLTIHHARIRRGDQVIDLLASGRRFTVVRREGALERAQVDGVLTAFLQPEGVQVGDIIDFAATISEREGGIALRPDAFVILVPGVSFETYAARSIWPEALPVRWTGHGLFAPAKLRRLGDMQELSISLRNPRPATPPAGAPMRYMLADRIQLSSYADWVAVNDAIRPLFEAAAVLALDSPLRAEAARIAATHTTPEARMTAALRLVQDQVRYVADSLEDRHYRPIAADTAWAQRYGDCKAKTVMLLALLRELGVAADPVLVHSSNGDLSRELLPSPVAFDHVVVRARIGERVYWLDGTRMGDRAPDMLETFEFRSGLPLIAGASLEQPVLIPAARPMEDREISVDASGGMALPAPTTARAVFRGVGGQGVLLATSTLVGEQRDEALKRYWTRNYPAFDVASTELSEDGGDVVLTARGTTRIDWRRRGARSLPAYAIDRSVTEWTPPFAIADGARIDAPYALPFPLHVASRETVTLPADGEGFEVDAEPIDDTVGGAHIRREVKVAGPTVTVRSTFRTMQPEIDPAAAAAARDKITDLNARPALIYATSYRPSAAETTAVAALAPSVADRLDEGYGHYRAGRFLEAVASFDLAIEADPSRADAWANRGIANFWLGNFAEAAADIDRAGSIEPTHFVIFNTRGLLAAHRGRDEDAIAAFNRSLESNPTDSWARWRLLTAYTRTDNWDRALAEVDALATAEPDQADSLKLDRASLLFARGDRAAALALANETVADGDVPGLMRNYAIARKLNETRLMRSLAARLRRAVAATPLATPRETHARKADVLEAIGDLPGAISAYDHAIAASPDDATLLNGRCWLRATHNIALDAALADCDRALAIMPDSAAILDSRGVVLFRLGRDEEALAAFNEALRQSPVLPAALYGRGLVNYRLGNEDAARSDITAAHGHSAGIIETYSDWGLSPPAELFLVPAS